MKFTKLSEEQKTYGIEVKLLITYEELDKCSNREFDNFYEGTRKKLGCILPSIQTGARPDGIILIFSGCSTPGNL
ncbi:MAG: hypothetical protein NTX66_02185 [Candidatus Falkowbacteria bacterium]|nr:hypothetical protein [Candidatus Falkowbacteria bacterium]